MLALVCCVKLCRLYCTPLYLLRFVFLYNAIQTVSPGCLGVNVNTHERACKSTGISELCPRLHFLPVTFALTPYCRAYTTEPLG
jgi:hypothetical protein